MPPQIPLDPSIITALHEAGKSSYCIAAITGVDPSTIQRRLKKLTPRKATSIFRELRADILSEKQRQLMMQASAPGHKNARDQRDLATAMAIYYDKERLERGQSTSNHSVQVGLSEGMQSLLSKIISREDC
jgi:hypothetical protein